MASTPNIEMSMSMAGKEVVGKSVERQPVG